MTTFRVPLEDIRVRKPVPCGMDPYTLMSLVPLMRTTTDGDGWRLMDGRHRFVAALIGGRQDILAEQDYDSGDSVTEMAAIRERTSPAA